MSDEEKIKQLENKIKELDKENQGLFELYNFNDSSLLTKILKDYKNTIEKQSKEIEELKFKYQARKDRTSKEIEELKEKEKNLLFQLKDSEKELLEVTKNIVSKDKIKAIIEEIDKSYEDSKNEDGESEYYYPNYTVEVLQSLLEKED